MSQSDNFDPPGAAAEGEPETCIACGQMFVEGDLYLPDASGGLIHRACCGPEREGFCNLETGEPLGPDEELPAGMPWTKDVG